jgi:serine protease AprX
VKDASRALAARLALVALVAVAARGRLGAAPAQATPPPPDGSMASGLARRAYWVFLAPPGEELAKRRLAERGPRAASPRALARRALRGSGAERALSAADLPVDRAARDAVLGSGARLRAESRWLHAISVEATRAESAAIAALSEVVAMRPVARSAARLPPLDDAGKEPHDGLRDRRGAAGELEYGASRAQLEQIGITKLHDQGLSGAGVMIGILDTGFDYDHRAFASTRIVAQRDFVNDDDDVADEQFESVAGHGTGVFSLIGAFDPGAMIGAAYEADFVLAKTEVFATETQVEEDYWVAGLEWADSLGADIVSSSLGYNTFDNPADSYTYEQMDGETALVTQAANLAVQRGIVVVNAMGNEGNEAWRHMIAPADAEEVISVGAVNAAGFLANFSSVGPTADDRVKPDVVALGVNNLRARAGARSEPFYVTGQSGTSYSTPLIAGAAALLLEAHPEYAPLQVQLAFRESATRCATPDTLYGWGLLRADVAVAHADPGSGCDTAAVDTTMSEPPEPEPLLTRPSGDVFAPALGVLDWTLVLPVDSPVLSRVFDPAGRFVATLLDGDYLAGDIPIPWDGRAEGEDVPPGVYFVRIDSAGRPVTERLVLLR